MSKEGFAQEIYQIIGSEPLSLYNDEGNDVYEPEEATSFFLKRNGIMIQIKDNPNVLEVSLSDGVDAGQFEKTYGSKLRKISLNQTYKYLLRTYGRKLTPKDFAENIPVLENINEAFTPDNTKIYSIEDINDGDRSAMIIGGRVLDTTKMAEPEIFSSFTKINLKNINVPKNVPLLYHGSGSKFSKFKNNSWFTNHPFLAQAHSSMNSLGMGDEYIYVCVATIKHPLINPDHFTPGHEDHNNDIVKFYKKNPQYDSMIWKNSPDAGMGNQDIYNIRDGSAVKILKRWKVEYVEVSSEDFDKIVNSREQREIKSAKPKNFKFLRSTNLPNRMKFVPAFIDDFSSKEQNPFGFPDPDKKMTKSEFDRLWTIARDKRLEWLNQEEQNKEPEKATTEGLNENMYGSSKSSYEKIGGSKVIIRHSSAVNEEKRGSRTRNIRQVFVETADGERFRIPHQNLHAAKSIAYHLNNEGFFGDNISNKILEMAERMNELKGLHLNEEDQDKKYWIRAEFLSIREGLKRAYSSKRSYRDFVEKLSPTPLKEAVEFENWAISLVPSDHLNEDYEENIVSQYLYKINHATKSQLPKLISEMIQLGISDEVVKNLNWPIKTMVTEAIEDQTKIDVDRAWQMKVNDIKRHKLSVKDAIEDVCSEFANPETYQEIKEYLTNMAEDSGLMPKDPNEIMIDDVLSRNRKLRDDLQTIKAQEYYGQARFIGESEEDGEDREIYDLWIKIMRTVGQGMGYQVALDQTIGEISAKYKITTEEAAQKVNAALDKFASKG